MLAVDIGNSRFKWALFHGDQIRNSGSSVYSYENFEDMLNSSCMPDSPENVMVSCVAGEGIKDQFVKWGRKKSYANIDFAVTYKKQNGVVNSYLQPEKMGVDRWLAMLAAFREYASNEIEFICVVDCGTAITLDVLRSDGLHQGGLIMPGYQVMIQSLVQGTENIQHEKKNVLEEAKYAGLGSSTADALVKGCGQIIVQGLSGIINSYQKDPASDLCCILTGGDAQWVSSELAIENIHDPFLVLKGLNIVSKKQGAK